MYKVILEFFKDPVIARDLCSMEEFLADRPNIYNYNYQSIDKQLFKEFEKELTIQTRQLNVEPEIIGNDLLNLSKYKTLLRDIPYWIQWVPNTLQFLKVVDEKRKYKIESKRVKKVECIKKVEEPDYLESMKQFFEEQQQEDGAFI